LRKFPGKVTRPLESVFKILMSAIKAPLVNNPFLIAIIFPFVTPVNSGQNLAAGQSEFRGLKMVDRSGGGTVRQDLQDRSDSFPRFRMERRKFPSSPAADLKNRGYPGELFGGVDKFIQKLRYIFPEFGIGSPSLRQEKK
jgi:hypothetical protein